MGFMDDFARRARDELEALRRTLAEAGLPFGASSADRREFVPGGGADEETVTAGPGASVVVAPEPEGARRKGTPTAWPHEMREAWATLELPLGSGLDAVAGAHARLIERFAPERVDDLPDGPARADAIRARLDAAEQRLVRWFGPQA